MLRDQLIVYYLFIICTSGLENPHCICGYHMTTFRSEFIPSTMWIPGHCLGSSCLVGKGP